jgi:hypothetical protein
VSYEFLSMMFRNEGAVRFTINGKPAPDDLNLVGIDPIGFEGFENGTAHLYFESASFNVVKQGTVCQHVIMDGERKEKIGTLIMGENRYEIIDLEWSI